MKCQVQNCIDFSSKLGLQKWGHRFKEHNNFKKSPYEENPISNSFQQVLLKKWQYFACNWILKEFWIFLFKIYKKIIGDRIGESKNQNLQLLFVCQIQNILPNRTL